MAAVCHRELRHYDFGDFGELVDRIDHHAIIADGVDGAGTDRRPRCWSSLARSWASSSSSRAQRAIAQRRHSRADRVLLVDMACRGRRNQHH